MVHIKETLISTCLIALLALSPTAAYAKLEAKMSVDSLVGQVEVVKDTLRQIEEEQEAQRIAEERAAIGSAIADASYWTASTGYGLCAAWVSSVYQNAGYGYVGGNACDMFWSWCTSSDYSTLAPGMLIAVPSHTLTSAGRIYGHVGIITYHDGQWFVRHNIGYIAEDTLETWIATYSTTYTPRWGFAAGI